MRKYQKTLNNVIIGLLIFSVIFLIIGKLDRNEQDAKERLKQISKSSFKLVENNPGVDNNPYATGYKKYIYFYHKDENWTLSNSDILFLENIPHIPKQDYIKIFIKNDPLLHAANLDTHKIAGSYSLKIKTNESPNSVINIIIDYFNRIQRTVISEHTTP